MRPNQIMALVLIPILASGAASAVQCKVQGETEIMRCLLGGLLSGIVTVAFFFIGLMLGGGN